MNQATPRRRQGIVYGLAAYGIWGTFPLYFAMLRRSGPVEIVMHRVLWSLVVCLIAVAVLRRGRDIGQALRSGRTVVRLTVAALVLALNWGFYVYGVTSGQVVQASLGYFINPLVTVLLGVIVLRERLRPAQWTAVGIGALAVAVLTIDYGSPPWLALTLAFSFAVYGLIKNRVGATHGALTSLTTETVVLAPLAAVVLVWLEVRGDGHFAANPPWQGLLLTGAGLATVIPLLMFAAAARRLPLSTIGLMQFLTPVLQLMCGVLVLGERVPPSRWIGFALVWVALAVLTGDSLRAARRQARSIPAADADPLPV
jgi:chloramphenicol-sensitive protein RarD